MKINNNYKDRIKILAGILKEGRNEDQARAILKKSGKENAYDQLINLNPEALGDRNKNLPFIAYFYSNGITNLNILEKDFSDYTKLINKKQIKPLQIIKGKIYLGKEGIDYLRFSEIVHGKKSLSSDIKISGKNDGEIIGKKPIFHIDGVIDIYKATSHKECVIYGSGYSFCISQPHGTHWQSYRDTKSSTFYFVFDRTRDKSDPLHIVVVDVTEFGIELTDANNKTGTISEYGENVDEYIEYLDYLGVPTYDIFVNDTKSEKEKKEQEILGVENKNLEWFKNLSNEFKSKYIGRGHELSHSQFNWLWENRKTKTGHFLLNQYLSTGLSLGSEWIKKIEDDLNLLKAYLRTRILVSSQEGYIFNYEIEKIGEYAERLNLEVSKLSSKDISTLLINYPNLIERVDLNKVKFQDANTILENQPELAHYFIKLGSKLRYDILGNILDYKPELAEEMLKYKDELNSDQIYIIIRYRPDLANQLDTSKLESKHISPIISSYPELFPIIDIKKISDWWIKDAVINKPEYIKYFIKYADNLRVNQILGIISGIAISGRDVDLIDNFDLRELNSYQLYEIAKLGTKFAEKLGARLSDIAPGTQKELIKKNPELEAVFKKYNSNHLEEIRIIIRNILS